jgi:hypothetical protein
VTAPEDWTEPERRLWHAYHRGEWYDLRGREDETAIRAGVLQSLVLGSTEPAQGRIAKLRIAGARITGQLDLRDADMDFGILLTDCTIDEPLLLSGASLRLLLDRSTLAGVIAQDAHIIGSLLARGVTVTGPVRLRGLRVDGNVDLSGATLSNPDGDAMGGDNLTVDGSLLIGDGFTATGGLRLDGARIGRDLNLDGATVHGTIYLAESAVQRLRLSLRPESTGKVDLVDSRVGRLYLRPDRWPSGCTLGLDGFTVERIVAGRWPARARVEWIERNTTHYTPSAYEQFAADYRREGHEADARLVLRSKELRRHRQLGPAGRIWGWIQHVTVGFGYAPGRALLWLAALLVAGTAYFAGNRLAPVNPDETPTWQPFVYTLDLIVPLVDFGHERAYDPTGADQAVALSLVVLGWVLAAAVVAGASRTLKRQ